MKTLIIIAILATCYVWRPVCPIDWLIGNEWGEQPVLYWV